MLKEIRRQIAAENEIEFVTSECKHKGSCAGTCPKCEAEVVYLENQLAARRRLGKVVKLVGLSMGPGAGDIHRLQSPGRGYGRSGSICNSRRYSPISVV